MANPYAPPNAPVSDPSRPGEDDYVYAGFWMRFVAFFIDNIILAIIIVPLLYLVYGKDYFVLKGDSAYAGTADVLIQIVFPLVAIVLFWVTKQATPGKMLFSMRIVNARTGGKPSVGQAIGRYFAYIPSFLVIFLGFFWIGWDARKQGWHDKLAGTLVIRDAR